MNHYRLWYVRSRIKNLNSFRESRVILTLLWNINIYDILILSKPLIELNSKHLLKTSFMTLLWICVYITLAIFTFPSLTFLLFDVLSYKIIIIFRVWLWMSCIRRFKLKLINIDRLNILSHHFWIYFDELSLFNDEMNLCTGLFV